MARIRSIHPGLWTDEAFVGLTPFARLFFMGIWGECDDNGSFEWSPLKLKMRLLPADNVDAAALLAELETAAAIKRYTVEGRSFGAVRNFCRYQRPKKPNSVYPQTDEVRDWVGSEARSTRDGSEQAGASTSASSEADAASTVHDGEAVGNQLPTGGEKSRQMKEGGGRRSSVANATGAPPPISDDPSKVLFDAGVALLVKAGQSDRQARGLIARWRKAKGEAWTREALVSAEDKADPVSWIEARGKSSSAVEDEAAAISRATAERYRRMDMPGPPDGAQLEAAA